MPFYVAVDHDHQAVVVSIRGSLSIEVRNEAICCKKYFEIKYTKVEKTFKLGSMFVCFTKHQQNAI